MKNRTMTEMAKSLSDTEEEAKTGAGILKAVMRAQSGRWTEIARETMGTEAGAHERRQRYIYRKSKEYRMFTPEFRFRVVLETLIRA